MIYHLTVGSIVIAVSVGIQAEMLNLLSRRFDIVLRLCRRLFRRFANTFALIIAVLYILFIQTIIVWLWAVIFVLVGALPAFEPALYFSLVSFTTVGYGDVVLDPQWRLLSGLTAANGFLSFGWSTAYMVELVRRTA
jgi:hypothetical protein